MMTLQTHEIEEWAPQMAALVIDGDSVTVEMSAAERLWTLRRPVSVKRSAVAGVDVHDDPLGAVEGIRAPGLALPCRRIGTWRGRWGKDLVAVTKGQAAVVVRLQGAPWRRLLVSYPDRPAADRAAAALSQ